MERYSNIDPSTNTRASSKPVYYGNYLGIVVQNNDPQKQGRVKIFVPHISCALYGKWDKIAEDKQFRFIGRNIDSDLTDIVDDLKTMLPWANCAAPLAGASSSGRYNAKLETGSISDSARLETTLSAAAASDYALNSDGIGEKPARKYEVTGLYLQDAFNDVSTSNAGASAIKTGYPNEVNKYTKHYSPKSYSNCAKGSFSVPNVGSHVWVFFEGGDAMHPTYFATSFGAEDWQAIYESSDTEHGIDYPGAYENKSDRDDPSYNHNTETYRNKFVINQKGGTLEFVNTDNKEVLRMTHYSGSYKELNNYTSTELAANNDQKLVLADQFLTVRGNRSEYVNDDYDLIVRGDHYKKIGNFNKENFQKWHDIVSGIADLKQLFEIKRATWHDTGEIAFQRQSPAQNQSGTFAPCPVCCSEDRQYYWPIRNTGLSTLAIPSTWSGNSNVYTATITLPNNYDGLIRTGTQTFVSPNGSVSGFTSTQPGGGSANFLDGGNCPICNGTGLSPSTQEGTWASEDKQTKVTEKFRQHIAELALIEKELGLGGSEISHITKHKVETIGLVMNDFPNIRIDEIGKINNSEVLIFPDGVITGMSSSPLIEYVHVDDLPGGTSTLNVCNRYNVQVGAGGMSLKTYGPVDIGGTIVNVGGEQVNLASENEINIVADKRLNIVAEILTLRQKNYKQVLVDSNLGVSQNVIIGGGLHVEGELTVNHITAPVEIQQTEETYAYGTANNTSAQIIGYLDNGSVPPDPDPCGESGKNKKVGPTPVYSSLGTPEGYGCGGGGEDGERWVASTDALFTHPHSHQFKNVPLHLMETNNDVRKVAKKLEKPFKAPASPVENECKGGGLLETGESI